MPIPPYPPYEQGLRPVPARPEPEQPRRKDVPIEPVQSAPVVIHHVTERVIERPVEVQQPGPKPPFWDVREPEVPKRESEVERQPEQKTIRETIPGQEQKQFPEQFGNNSPNNSDSELLEPPEPAPQAGIAPYKKKGKVGRQRKYEEPGNNGEIPVKKVVLFRHIKGRHWPGMSQDMQEWYDKYYFTKPKKTGKGVDHARHLRSYERGQRWIAEHEGRAYQPGTVGHSGKIVAYRKRATN